MITLTISDALIAKLLNVSDETFGKIYGTLCKNVVYLLAAVADNEVPPPLFYSLPRGLDFFGRFSISKNYLPETKILELLHEEVVEVIDWPLFLSCQIGNVKSLTSYTLNKGDVITLSHSVITLDTFYQDFLYVRLKGGFDKKCALNKSSYDQALHELEELVNSGKMTFNFKNQHLYLLENGHDPVNLKDDVTVETACNTILKDRKTASSKSPTVLDMQILRKLTQIEDTFQSLLGETIKKYEHSPIVVVNQDVYDTATIPFLIDSLCLINKKVGLRHLYNVLISCILDGLRNFHSALVTNLEGDVPVPIQVLHFLPKRCGHFVSIWLPTELDESKFQAGRTKLHQNLLLSVKKPLFKRANRFSFEELPCANFGDKLVNPHNDVKNTNNGGKIAVVKGNYLYYHYNQDNIDDSGWGCAYRSLQTLASWFQQQGYTDRNVPTFHEIQKCLVDIGDKPASFLGSKQWIGSMEVNFVLDTLFGLTCRIVNVSNGSEMAYEGAQLLRHFQDFGTPIMIGGGSLAHTILGVDYNEATGGIKFLILDPHYTGPEDLKVIIKKGWCGWKGVEFWSKTSYYNMCIPLVPSGV